MKEGFRFWFFSDLREVKEATCAACSESGGKYSYDTRNNIKATLRIKNKNPA